jgi:hypothetical protein
MLAVVFGGVNLEKERAQRLLSPYLPNRRGELLQQQ